ncbi:TolC family protein [Litoricolaceae bacterium]|nr:TolC family protein [Litorivicinaceae bacterium]
MPFDNRALKALPGFLCGALLILTSSLAHAERVLTETIFDDDGVRSFTYDRVESSEPEPSERDAPELTSESTSKAQPGLFQILSNIFKGQSNSSDVEVGLPDAVGSKAPGVTTVVETPLSGSEAAPSRQAESANFNLNSERAIQERLEVLIGGPASVSEAEASVTPPTVPESLSTSELTQADEDGSTLSSEMRRAERIQAIFGDSSPEERADVPLIQSEELAPSIESEIASESPSQETFVESEDQTPETSSDQVDTQEQELASDQLDKPNLVQRFFGFLRRELDAPRNIPEESKPENVEPIEEATEINSALSEKGFAVELPSIQGQPESNQDEELDQDVAEVLQPSSKIPSNNLDPQIPKREPLTEPPVNAEQELRKPLDREVPPRAIDGEQSAELNPNVLNPLMIGKELDAFAFGLINDVRRGDERRPFQEFSKQISDIFFSTPTVLRLIELEKTLNTQVAEAEALARPQVGFSAEEGRRSVSGGSDGRISSQTVTATQSLWDFGIIESGVQQSRNNVEKTLVEIRDSRSEALLDLILAYNELATSRMNMRLVEVFAETRVQFLDLVDQKLALGVSSEADLVRAEAKAYEAQGELPAAAQRLQLAEDRFIELFGVIPPDTIPLFKLPSNQLNLAELGRMTERHPIVVATDLDYQNAQLNLQRLSSEKLGAFNVQLSGSRSDTPTTSSTDQLDGKIVYQVDLYDGGDLSARLERASGAVVEARWELERVRRETKRILESAISELVASQSLESARLNSLEATVKASDATKELFMYDRGDLTDIFRVQDDYLNAAKALVEARASSQNAFYSSLHAADLLIEQFGLGI